MNLRRSFLFLVLAGIISISAFFIFRQLLIVTANKQVDILLKETAEDSNALIFQATKISHDSFRQNAGRDADNPKPFLMKLRPYLTNTRLPDFVAVPDGAIETIYAGGWCDDAARMLQFILAHKGLESRQWNMVWPDSGHSALVVDLPDGKEIFADPYYGVVAKTPDGHLAGPRDKNIHFESLSETSDMRLYNNFDKAVMGAQGEPLVIEFATPAHLPLTLGTLDGNAEDVLSAAMKNDMGPYWTYMGHRYDRAWVRVLEAAAPVKVTFILVDTAEKGVLTTDKAPVISGKTLSWTLDKGERLTFTDGQAKLSLRRLNSYIPVDQIIFEPL